jgi:hypothetical protein
MGCVCKRNQEAFYSDRFAAIPLERFSPQQEGVMIPVSEMHPIRFVRLTSDQIQGENLDAMDHFTVVPPIDFIQPSFLQRY